MPESHRVAHGQYTVIPKAKQLYNGNWIVDIMLLEEREDGNRLYDFFGPMTEYGSADDTQSCHKFHLVVQYRITEPHRCRRYCLGAFMPLPYASMATSLS